MEHGRLGAARRRPIPQASPNSAMRGGVQGGGEYPAAWKRLSTGKDGQIAGPDPTQMGARYASKYPSWEDEVSETTSPR